MLVCSTEIQTVDVHSAWQNCVCLFRFCYFKNSVKCQGFFFSSRIIFFFTVELNLRGKEEYLGIRQVVQYSLIQCYNNVYKPLLLHQIVLRCY